MAMDDKKLNEMRERADTLGVKYHHRANAKTIEAAVNAYIVAAEGAALYPKEAKMEQILNEITAPSGGPPSYEEPMTEVEWNKTQAGIHAKLSGALVRCRIQNMNSQKKNWPGEFISVGSAKVGTFKKFIPFGTGEPYHIPRIIYNELKGKQCSQFYPGKGTQGQTITKSRLINEYVIDELDPLTRQELKDLALQQAMAQGKEA
jgi:hypothetical protein